jgi:hypothetical protein
MMKHLMHKSGGGGNRTRVQMRDGTGCYMLSHAIYPLTLDARGRASRVAA